MVSDCSGCWWKWACSDEGAQIIEALVFLCWFGGGLRYTGVYPRSLWADFGLEDSYTTDHYQLRMASRGMSFIVSPVFVGPYKYPNWLTLTVSYWQQNKYFEDAFKVYERGVKIFKYPHVKDIWVIYLSKFVERYGKTKLERARELFEHAIEMVCFFSHDLNSFVLRSLLYR